MQLNFEFRYQALHCMQNRGAGGRAAQAALWAVAVAVFISVE